MNKPHIKSPSSSISALNKEQADNTISNTKKTNSITLILTGIIICLLLIIISLLMKPALNNNIKNEQENISDQISKSIDAINNEIKKEIGTNENIKEKSVITNVNDKIEVSGEITIVEEPDSQEENSEIKNKTIDKDFNNRINETLINIEKHQYNLAKKNLDVANKLKENDPIIKELAQRIETGSQQVKLNRLIKKSQYEEENENWANAINYYNKILAIDSNMSSVLVKKQRSLIYQNINLNLNKVLNKPERLQNDKVFEGSKILLKSVKTEMNEKKDLLYPMQKTPKLNSKIIKVEFIINQASIPITVNIVSDNLTEIVIYKVGRFGKLIEKKLELRSGSYTIVGSRAGYRDYRKIIKIDPKSPSIVVRVECREAI